MDGIKRDYFGWDHHIMTKQNDSILFTRISQDRTTLDLVIESPNVTEYYKLSKERALWLAENLIKTSRVLTDG